MQERGGEICAMIKKHFTSQSSSRKYCRALERRAERDEGRAPAGVKLHALLGKTR